MDSRWYASNFYVVTIDICPQFDTKASFNPGTEENSVTRM
jgi:hypothetical protein